MNQQRGFHVCASGQMISDYAIPNSENKNEPFLLSIAPISKVHEEPLKSQVYPAEVDGQGQLEQTCDTKVDQEKQEKTKRWNELTIKERIVVICWCILKLIFLLVLLYLFIYSLDILSSAFRLLGGRTAGTVFRESQLLRNPVCGLMIGVLATVLLQSSSTSTSILVSMVASEILDVRAAIPIVMGANVGTSLTNTLVSAAHSNDREQFRRAFAGATVHDMFNWLSVLVLLPIEALTGYLYHLTTAIIHWMNLKTAGGAEPPQLLAVLTKPLADLTVQLDKSIIEKLAMGELQPENVTSFIKRTCQDGKTCRHIFASFDISDTAVGVILLIFSLAMLIGCLICIVKLLSSILRGRVINIVQNTINAELPGRWSCLTGYIAMAVGALMTIVVQSSSVFTSALTPLVGLGVLSVERMYPLTLGSNVGTTFTSVLAALATPARTLPSALQISFCHLFFNLSGILLFYPIPCSRRLPIGMAHLLGDTTGQYRWFAIVYVVFAFFLLPASIFGLSMLGDVVLISVTVPIFLILLLIISINIIQRKCPSILPKFIRNWDNLPAWMHSLEPYDKLVSMCSFPCGTQSTPAGSSSVAASESRTKLVSASNAGSRAESPARFAVNSSFSSLPV